MTIQQTVPYGRAQVYRQRIQALFRRGNHALLQNDVLAQAFDELASVLESLQTAEAALENSRKEQLVEQVGLEQRLQAYQELFAQAPAAYLITRLDGTITQSNQAAAAMLKTSERQLIGRSFTLFVPDGQRRPFRQQITQLPQQDVSTWEQALQSWDDQPMNVLVRVSVARGASQLPQALRWMLFPLPQNDE